MTTLHDFSAIALDGTERDLADYAGRVVLVVNTASRCGLTPQLEGLEALHRELGGDGLVILGFPCNQFARQEPGTSEEIGAFCRASYGVSFPMFARIDVNGRAAHPLYRWLTRETRGLTGGRIKWNFTKFLVGADGRVVRRYAPTTEPSAIAADIRAALAALPAQPK
ncbi:glutathione peroxidase [Demequina sp. SYSU T00192]|uniref:Glutathione peroxidase n=1 Tax=Demequina litoralis TaxID=3051660 RepID=A0ABT8G5J4_9MICO|nr:glutathione peroxidase [Demequina sp. SYSU T00192]MDN4474403.1 glutathione peroxidase [Demequina sp. SYSU T00192]